MIRLGRTNTADTVDLFYQMGSSPIARRYFRLIEESLAAGKRIHRAASSLRSPRSAEDLDKLVAAINALLDEVTVEPAVQIPERLHSKVEQADLNSLHWKMENYSRSCYSGDMQLSDKGKVGGILSRINVLIHQLETCLRYRRLRRSVGKTNLNFGLTLQLENHDVLPLYKEDYENFVLTPPYGALLLGYNTLGKNFVDTCRDDDMRLVHSRSIKPQRTFSTDTVTNFAPRVPGRYALLKLWWEESALEDYGYRWGEPQNAIGAIPVGFWMPVGPFRYRTHQEIVEILSYFDDISQIGFRSSILT